MSFDRALEKAMRYCSYQERCVQDLEKRFYAWNVKKSEWDKILDYLLEEDFLNETRFIEAYVRGKFLIKKWGRNRISMGLMQKHINGKKVLEAFDSEIDEEVYLQTIRNLLEKKSQLINEPEKLKRRDKLYRYLMSKGYESDLIVKELNSF